MGCLSLINSQNNIRRHTKRAHLKSIVPTKNDDRPAHKSSRSERPTQFNIISQRRAAFSIDD